MINDIRQTEIHTADLLLRELSAFEIEMAVEKLKKHKSPGIDQIPAEFIKAGRRTIRSDIHKLINSIWIKKEFPEKWKESIILPISKVAIKQVLRSLKCPGRKHENWTTQASR